MAPLDSSENDFVILPISMAPSASYAQTATHEVRIRRNAPKVPTADDPRSLFLKNIPVDSTEAHFRAVFTDLVGAGRFESMALEGKRGAALAIDPAQATKLAGFAGQKRKRANVEAMEDEATRLPEIWSRRTQQSSGTALVLLADEKSVQLVLKAIAKLHKTKKFPTWGKDVSDADAPSLGARWVTSHLQLSRVDKRATQAAVHAFFTTFNRKEKEAIELAKRLRNEPDEDGFVTVTRGGRAAPAGRREAEEARQRMVDRETKKKGELKDFYRFQLRERRKAEQAKMMRRFDEDRRRVSVMKEKRGRFKPEA